MTQSYDKILYTTENSNGKVTKKDTKMFEHAVMAGRLGTVNWNNESNSTGAVNEPNLPTPQDSRNIKRKHIEILVLVVICIKDV